MNQTKFTMDYLVKEEANEISSPSFDEGYSSSCKSSSRSTTRFSSDSENVFSPASLLRSFNSPFQSAFNQYTPRQETSPRNSFDSEIILQGLLTQIRSNMLKMVDNSLAQIEYALRTQQLDPTLLAGYLGGGQLFNSNPREDLRLSPKREHGTSTPLRKVNDRKRNLEELLNPTDMNNNQTELRLDEHSVSSDSRVINMSLNSVLNTAHLRKAKQMFMFTRYPSSALLKRVFSDINFTRSNTSQLIKWFSNFREYLFINIEKYARQLVSLGIVLSQSLPVIDEDNDLVINLVNHYNKSRGIAVPEEFIKLIETCLSKFHEAIAAKEDRNAGWKKPIYKEIIQLEQTLPSYFFEQ